MPETLTLPGKRIIDSELGITAEELVGGRRKFELAIGTDAKIVVDDIPAPELTDDEWAQIVRARDSYRQMWGGNGVMEIIEEDPFDGRSPHDRSYKTTHQIASVVVAGVIQVVLTNRKVALQPHASEETSLFDDVAFWNVLNSHNNVTPLWEKYKEMFVKMNWRYPRLGIVAISRTGSHWNASSTKDERAHDLAAASWALMQIAVTEALDARLIVCQLCEELQQKVLAVKDKTGQRHVLNFTKTEDVLPFKAGERLVLDRRSEYLREHIFKFPGYWTNNADLTQLLLRLVGDNRISITFLQAACTELVQVSDWRYVVGAEDRLAISKIIDGDGDRDDLTRAVKIFTVARYCKHLIPLINASGNISPNLTGDDLRALILTEVGDGPFSATLIPDQWRESALNLLRVVKQKHTE